jgi:TM2 domain-containing membrane protein YozV
MRSLFAAVLAAAILAPALAEAEPAVVRTFEAKIYSTPSSTGWVVGDLQEGAKVSVSEDSVSGFRRIRLKDGTIGYIDERLLTFSAGSASAAAATATAAPVPTASPAAAPITPTALGPYRDVVYLKNGSVVRGLITEQTPNVALKIQSADGNVYVFQMSEVEKLGREAAPAARLSEQDIVAQEKSPAVAWVLSFLIPGIGQYYNGDIAKGVVMNVLYFGGWTMYAVAFTRSTTCTYNFCYTNSSSNTLAWVGLGVATGTWIWSMIDAPISASAHNANVRAWARTYGHLFQQDLGGAVVALDLAPNFRGGAVGQVTLHY